MNNEVWKDIVGYEGYYQVSDQGRVRSVDRIITCADGRIRRYKSRILKFGKNQKGYLLTTLCKDGTQKTFKVHRLVAEAFIPNPDNKPECDHKDKDKTNNCVSNLWWVSTEENWEHGTQNGRKIMPVQCIETGIVYKSIMEAKRQTGISNICMACKGKYKTVGGYHWTYYKGGIV